VRFSRERLALECADDMRIISLITLETADSDERDDLLDATETFDEDLTAGVEYRRTTGFRFEPMEPLTGVRRRDLRHYFDSEFCTCPDGLRQDYPALLLQGRDELPFDQAVALIRVARDRGWHAMKTDLEQQRPPAVSADRQPHPARETDGRPTPRPCRSAPVRSPPGAPAGA